ncbi:uncharacterized protein LOC129806400 [Phlebotomus papatasi]|uniref:uncharacterized protein LOC129806400 n=1 Tax=Phlebotomus papatasi TaxID=29031 RepID=UPI0024837F21|nr:uncharacterized protein LOC129806400 [Phlebotomus papatasi]
MEERERSELQALCLEFGVPELFQEFVEKHVTVARLKEADEKDIEVLLPSHGSRITFKRKWREWKDIVGSSTPSAAKTAPRKTWFSFHLDDIVQYPEWDRVQKYYSHNGCLDDRHRDILISIIIQYGNDHNILLSCKIMKTISEEIEEHFPTEEKGHYFQPKNNMRKSYGGRLYNKYANVKRAQKRMKRTHDDDHSAEVVEGSNSAENNQDLPNMKEWLKTMVSEEMSVNVREIWKLTFSLRKEDLFNGTTDDILQKWPLYGHENGKSLVILRVFIFFLQINLF